ncbi:MAG: FtsX-like permease family protein [Bacillota bacterium]|nr:FtsX-like permease family protein [Bacillota bacterium]
MLYPDRRGAKTQKCGNTTQTNLVGTNETFQRVRNTYTEEGRFISSEDVANSNKVAVLGTTVVTNLFGEDAGDILGEQIKIKGINYTVIGVLESKGSTGWMDNDNRIIAPISTVQQDVLEVDHIGAIYVDMHNINLMDSISKEITGLLRRQHQLEEDEANDFSITSQKDMLRVVGTITDSFTILLGGIAGISLLVGGIGVMNIMLVSVTERTREIGIRKAIGAKNRDILAQFLLEAVALTAVGGSVGIILGFVLSTIISRIAGWEPSVTPDAILMAVGFSAVIGIVFGVFPALKAAKMNPIDALRYE